MPHRDDEERHADDDDQQAGHAHAEEHLEVIPLEAAHGHVVDEELPCGGAATEQARGWRPPQQV